MCIKSGSRELKDRLSPLALRMSLLLALLLLPMPSLRAEAVKIGVLAFRPKPQTAEQWRPLALALKQAMPTRDFTVAAYTYAELNQAIAGHQVDFVLTNSGHYVLLRNRAGLSAPLATLVVHEGGLPMSVFGGVIFCRADQAQPHSLQELRGRRLAFTSTESLGGYQMQAYELSRVGIHLPKDATLMATGVPHDSVVEAVLAGRADVGFVRGGVLESMAREGKLDLKRIQVVNPRPAPAGAPAVSTRLYPEWPFAAMPGTDKNLARQVASALLLLEENKAAVSAMDIHGFGVSADYGSVEEVLRELRMPPFEAAPHFTAQDIWARYRWQVLAGCTATGVILLLGLRLLLVNRRLASEKRVVQQEQERLRSSEAQNRALISAIPDLMFTNHRDGEFLAVHASDPSLLLVPREALLHQKPLDVLPAPLANQFMKAYADALGSGTVQELHYSLPMGTVERHFEARVVADSEDRVITIVRDVTKGRQAEEEKARLRAQLDQAQKLESVGRLAGGIAHDMNNVLGAILGLATVHLETSPPGSPVHRAFETITKAANRGGKVVKGLLSIAHQTPAEERELDVNDLLREQVYLLERTTLSKVHLELDLAAALAPITGDPSALTHAFMNLCVNAVDAMPENGVLTLRTRNLDRSWIEVQVGDTGTGMSEEVLAKALDPFFTTKEVGKGTGLGLSMVYSTVKCHRGELELLSETGRGTLVKMRFPVSPSHALAPEPAGSILQVAPGDAMSVLLVDDDDLVQHSTRTLLEALGHRVTSATCGEEALARLEGGYLPDVVLLDMNMPGLGGAGTLPRLCKAQPFLPVFLCTGRADQSAMDLVATHAQVTLLAKPFGIRELQQHLERVRPVRT